MCQTEQNTYSVEILLLILLWSRRREFRTSRSENEQKLRRWGIVKHAPLMPRLGRTWYTYHIYSEGLGARRFQQVEIAIVACERLIN